MAKQVSVSHPSLTLLISHLRSDYESRQIELNYLKQFNISNRKEKEVDREFNRFLVTCWALMEGEGATESPLIDVLFAITRRDLSSM